MKSLNLSKLLVITFALSLFNLSFGAVYAQAPSDITNHWAQKEITSASSEGWAYIENGKFNPNRSATREEVIWMLVGAIGTVETDKFDSHKKADMSKYKDKPSEFVKVRMSEAIANGLISGYPDGTIKPKASITRAEFAVIMGRLIEKNAWYQEQSLPFKDFIPNWAFKDLQTAYKNGIIKGYEDNSFKPNAKVTKSEALVMINRWQKLNKLKPLPSQTLKNMSQAVPSAEFNNDNSMLLYYGPNGQTEADIREHFYIKQLEDGGLNIIVRDFEGKSYPQLKAALKPVLPTLADKVISVLKSPPESNDAELIGDNRKVIFTFTGGYVSIFIIK